MKIKTRFLTFDNFDLNTKTPTITNAILGNKIVIDAFPCTVETVTVVTVLEGVTRNTNNFNISISDSRNNKVGDIINYPSRTISFDGEALLCYRFNNLIFNSINDFYQIEVYNDGKLLEKFKLGVTTSFYDIYENFDIYGVMPSAIN